MANEYQAERTVSAIFKETEDPMKAEQAAWETIHQPGFDITQLF